MQAMGLSAAASKAGATLEGRYGRAWSISNLDVSSSFVGAFAVSLKRHTGIPTPEIQGRQHGRQQLDWLEIEWIAR